MWNMKNTERFAIDGVQLLLGRRWTAWFVLNRRGPENDGNNYIRHLDAGRRLPRLLVNQRLAVSGDNAVNQPVMYPLLTATGPPGASG